MLNILYFGDSSPGSSSAHRANALIRIGHHVTLCDPYKEFHKSLGTKLLEVIHHRTGYRFLNSKVSRWVAQTVSGQKPDLIWVNSGELFGPDSLKILKRIACPIVLYINDDPMGGRDGRRFDSLIKSLKYYDFCAVMRELNVSEFKEKGVKKVLRVHMSYDEVAHRPFEKESDLPEKYRSEVAFIGTWMRREKRDEFILALIRQGIPVSIWGDRWQKSPFFAELKPFWRGRALYGRDYVAAMQGAKICLGLLSKGNRDLHTTRSLETPYAGGLLCAERTSEHQEMFKEGVEAVFWSSVDECAQLCKELLANDEKRENIRLAGMRRVREIKAGNEDVCRSILHALYNGEGK